MQFFLSAVSHLASELGNAAGQRSSHGEILPELDLSSHALEGKKRVVWSPAIRYKRCRRRILLRGSFQQKGNTSHAHAGGCSRSYSGTRSVYGDREG